MNKAKNEVPAKYKALAEKYNLLDSPFFDERPEQEILFMMGDACKNRGDAEGMRAAFSLLVKDKNSPQHPEFHFRALFAQGHFREALDFASACRKAGKPLAHSLLWNPFGFSRALPREYFETALAELQKEKFTPAQQLARSFYAIFLQCCNGLADTYVSLSSNAQLALPEYDWLAAALGYEYLHSCRYGEAYEALSRAASSAGGDWMLLCKLGETLFCLGREKEALEKFAAARELSPGIADTWQGKILLFRGDCKGALNLLQPEESENAVWRGSDGELWRGAAQFLLGAANGPKIIESAYQANPSDDETKLWQARMLLRSGSLPEALALADSAVSSRSDYFWAQLLRARIQLELGNADKAFACAALAKNSSGALFNYLENKIKPGGNPVSSKSALKKFAVKAFTLAGANINPDPYLAKITFADFEPLAPIRPDGGSGSPAAGNAAAVFADKKVPAEIAELVVKYHLENSEFIDARPLERLICVCAQECMARGEMRGAREFYTLFLSREKADSLPAEKFRALFFLRDFAAAFELAFPEKGINPVPSPVLREPLPALESLPCEYLTASVASLKKARLDPRHSFISSFYGVYLANDSGGLLEFVASSGDEFGKYAWMGFVAGLRLLERCSYEKAAEYFSRSIKVCGPEPVAQCRLAEALLCSGSEKKAFALFAAARSASPDEVSAWKGEMLLILGRYAEALRALSCPGSMAPTWRCAAKLRLGRQEEALKELGGLVKNRITDREAALWHAYALLLAGEFEKADSAISSLLDAAPDYFWAHFVAAALRSGGEKGRALKHLKSAAALWPDVYKHLEKSLDKMTSPDTTREFALSALALAGGNLRNDYYLQGLSLKDFCPSERSSRRAGAR